ncbi:hypothetical protein HDU67_000937 [Dinochytrium kinnereticum]|nr:hypothetical protein HDU67_000937 [Dinochytrium kinnereticum]
MLRERSKEIHAALFSTSPQHKRHTIETHYAPQATFNDPLVSVQGLAPILSQFMFLTVFPKITSRLNLIQSHHDDISDTYLITLDSHITFTVIPYLLSIPVRCFTRLKYACSDDDEPVGLRHGAWMVIAHEDVWSLKDLIADFLYTGWIYETVRKWNGAVSSAVLEWAFNRWDPVGPRRVSGPSTGPRRSVSH